MASRSIDDVIEASWDVVTRTPGVMRNTAFHTHTRHRRLPGVYGFVMQHNPDHIKTKRPASTVTSATPTPVLATDDAALAAAAAAAAAAAPPLPVSRPFDPTKFNFTRAARSEIVVELAILGGSAFITYAAAGTSASSSASSASAAPSGISPLHLAAAARAQTMFVNVNPLFPYHNLLVPAPTACHAQVWTSALLGEVLLTASALRGRADWRFGFNSLAAWASVNHFHIHMSRCAAVFQAGVYPLEAAARRDLIGGPVPRLQLELQLQRITGYPLRGFVFSARADNAAAAALAGGGVDAADDVTPGADSAAAAAEAGAAATPAAVAHARTDGATASLLQRTAGAFLEHLVADNIAHTAYICDGGRAVIVLPRLQQVGTGAAEGAAMVIAMAEICGLGIVYSEADFDGYTEERFAEALAVNNIDARTFDALEAVATALVQRALKAEA